MPTTVPSVGFNPTESVPYIVTLGAKDADCFHKVGCWLEMKPSWRAQIGSLLLYCRDDMQPETPSYWQRPWMQHCWLVDPDGRIHDPSLHNLPGWAEEQSCGLPLPVEDMTARVVPYGEEQQQVVNELLFGPFNQTPEIPLVYLPGCLFSSPYDTQKPSKHWFQVWAGAAAASVHSGGFTSDQLSRAMGVVERMIRKGPAAPSAETGKGFG